MSDRLITLQQWLAQRYADGCAPTIGTARRWAKSGHIQPQPVKHGRSYCLYPDAVYTASKSSLVGRLIRETAEQGEHGLTA